ncbi:unnamed protein product [Camellia sinensis]
MSNVRKQSGTLAEAFERHEAKFRAEIDERKRKQGMEKMGLWRKALGEVADLGEGNCSSGITKGTWKAQQGVVS